MLLNEGLLLKELRFKSSRSGGKGGQNVNKVSSKVELNLDVNNSRALTPDQKERILARLANRINSQGILQVITEEDRSQLRNKEKSIEKLLALLTNALHDDKVRKKTRPGKLAAEKRLKAKQIKALKKINRSRQHWDL